MRSCDARSTSWRQRRRTPDRVLAQVEVPIAADHAVAGLLVQLDVHAAAALDRLAQEAGDLEVVEHGARDAGELGAKAIELVFHAFELCASPLCIGQLVGGANAKN